MCLLATPFEAKQSSVPNACIGCIGIRYETCSDLPLVPSVLENKEPGGHGKNAREEVKLSTTCETGHTSRTLQLFKPLKKKQNPFNCLLFMFLRLSFANAILDGSNAEEDLDQMPCSLLAMTTHAESIRGKFSHIIRGRDCVLLTRCNIRLHCMMNDEIIKFENSPDVKRQDNMIASDKVAAASSGWTGGLLFVAEFSGQIFTSVAPTPKEVSASFITSPSTTRRQSRK